jgi:hypothetical protein
MIPAGRYPTRAGILTVLTVVAVFGGAPAAQWGPAPCALTFTGPLFTAIAGELGGIVIDDACTHIYITNKTQNRIEDFSLQTLSLLPPIQVGSQPMGLDFGPGNRLLYVANSGGSNISVVDLQQRVELRKISVPASWNNDRPNAIAIGARGLALFSTTFRGSGFGGRMMQLNLDTEQVAHRTDFYSSGRTTENTWLRASGDRHTIGIALGASSQGSVHSYKAGSNTFSAPKTLANASFEISLDDTGSVSLVTPGTYVLDAALNLSGTVSGGHNKVGGNAVSPNGSTGYRSVASRIDVMNLRTFMKTGELLLGDAVTSAWSDNSIGQIDISVDGRLLAVITDHGVSLVPTGSTTFIDDPLIAGVTRSKAVHITELRLRIDAQRTRLGLQPVSWTDPSLAADLVVRAVHLSELRTAVQEAYSEAGLAPPVFSESPLLGILIKALHITELRSAVTTLEGS